MEGNSKKISKKIQIHSESQSTEDKRLEATAGLVETEKIDEKKEIEEINSASSQQTDNNRIKTANARLIKTEEAELKKEIETGIRSNTVHYKIDEIKPEKISLLLENSKIYKDSQINQKLLTSLRLFGQLDDAYGYIDPDTGQLVLLDGIHRAVTIDYINKKGLVRLVPLEGNSKKLVDSVETFKPMSLRIRILDLPYPKLKALQQIDFNINIPKTYSEKYFQAKELHKIFDPEGEQRRNSALKSFVVSSDLKKRFPKPENSKVSDVDYYNELYKSGTISEADLRASDKYILATKKEAHDTLKK